MSTITSYFLRHKCVPTHQISWSFHVFTRIIFVKCSREIRSIFVIHCSNTVTSVFVNLLGTIMASVFYFYSISATELSSNRKSNEFGVTLFSRASNRSGGSKSQYLRKKHIRYLQRLIRILCGYFFGILLGHLVRFKKRGCYEFVGAPQRLAATNLTFYVIRPKSFPHRSFVE